MATKAGLTAWVLEALHALGGSGTVTQVCKFIWDHHRDELELSGDLLYTWQYDVRWAAQILRNDGVLAPSDPKDTRWRVR